MGHSPFDELFLQLMPPYPVVRHLDIGTLTTNRATLVPAQHHLYNEVCRDDIARTPAPAFFGDCRLIVDYFPPGWFDLLTCLDVIEHLSTEQVEKMLGDMETLCSGRIILFTPYGYMKTEGQGEYHAHLSGWYPEDLKLRGYTCCVLPHMHNEFGAFYAIKDKRGPIERILVTGDDAWIRDAWWL